MKLLGLILKRLGLGLVTLFVISVLIFGAVEMLPGDIAQAVLGQGATEENLRALREQLGLNRPAPVRYWEWLSNALVGDFGVSLVSGDSVSEKIAPRFMNTLFLAAYAAVIAVGLVVIFTFKGSSTPAQLIVFAQIANGLLLPLVAIFLLLVSFPCINALRAALFKSSSS